MNTFLMGREGGTEADKETVEERQSEEVGSCGCEEAIVLDVLQCHIHTCVCTQTAQHHRFQLFSPHPKSGACLLAAIESHSKRRM